MKYVTKVTEEYVVQTNGEVEMLISEAKNDNRFVVSKYKCDKKEVKSKGEVIDEYFLVSITKVFNDPKEPSNEVVIEYEVS